jgi:hypothetical protein
LSAGNTVQVPSDPFCAHPLVGGLVVVVVVVVDVVVVEVVVVDAVVVVVEVVGAVVGTEVEVAGVASGDDEHPAATRSDTVSKPTRIRDIGQS